LYVGSAQGYLASLSGTFNTTIADYVKDVVYPVGFGRNDVVA
jgi:hypothetical protein